MVEVAGWWVDGGWGGGEGGFPFHQSQQFGRVVDKSKRLRSARGKQC